MTRIKTRLLAYLLLSICLTGCYDNAFNDTENASNQNNGNNNSNHAYDPPTAFAGESCNPQTFKEFCYDGVAMMCDFYQERVVGIDCRETGVLTCHSRRTDNYSTCTVGCYNYGEIIRNCSSTDSRVLLSKCDYGTDNKLYLFDEGYEWCLDGEECRSGKCQPTASIDPPPDTSSHYHWVRIDNISNENSYIDAICLVRKTGAIDCTHYINYSTIYVYNASSILDNPDMVGFNQSSPIDLMGTNCRPDGSSNCFESSCLNYSCSNAKYGIMFPDAFLAAYFDNPIQSGESLYIYAVGMQTSSSCSSGYSCLYGFGNIDFKVSISQDHSDGTQISNWNDVTWNFQGYIDIFPSFTFNIP